MFETDTKEKKNSKIVFFDGNVSLTQQDTEKGSTVNKRVEKFKFVFLLRGAILDVALQGGDAEHLREIKSVTMACVVFTLATN